MSKAFKIEEPWNSKLEHYVKHMRDVSDTQSHLHEHAGYKFKSKNNWFGLPSILIPLIMAPVSLMLEAADSGKLPYVNAVGFMLTGIFTGVYSFFKYGEKMERHFSFSARYSDIVTDIESELIKGRQFRTQADVLIIKIKMGLDNLNNSAPVIPQSISLKEKKLHPDTYDVMDYKKSNSNNDTSESDERMIKDKKRNSSPEHKIELGKFLPERKDLL
jgi:hypothetical protein